jgi:hypothetical protein
LQQETYIGNAARYSVLLKLGGVSLAIWSRGRRSFLNGRLTCNRANSRAAVAATGLLIARLTGMILVAGGVSLFSLGMS